MKTLEEIIDAVQRLSPDQFLRFRRKLDRLETKIWEREHEKVTKTLQKKGLSDEEIDRKVVRRRRESRI
jgi:DNA repair photolyase